MKLQQGAELKCNSSGTTCFGGVYRGRAPLEEGHWGMEGLQGATSLPREELEGQVPGDGGESEGDGEGKGETHAPVQPSQRIVRD